MPTKQTQMKRKYKAHPFSERKRVVELYESGCSIRQISRALDLGYNMIRQWLQLYRDSGLEALQPCYNLGVEPAPGVRATRWEENERDFSPAFVLYATTLEPAAVITRRYGLDYQSFVYHLRRYHPELMRQRSLLTLPVAEPAPAQ